MLREQFLEGMSHAAATVNVVTTDGAHGRAGVTVSAMCSVSAEPPSLLVCVHHASAASAVIRANGVLCVNVLRDDQAFVSDTFAGRLGAKGEDKFACADWTARSTGAPALEGALVTFDCRVKRSFRWGSHFIFIADVEAIATTDAGNPLIYANRAYGVPARLRDFGRVETGACPGDGAAPLRIGCFQTFAPFVMPKLQRRFLAERGPVAIQTLEGEQSELLDGLEDGSLDLALLYDFELEAAGLETTLLAEIPPHALLPAAHRLAERRAVSLRDLAPEPMVLLDLNPSRDYFTSLFEEVGLRPTIAARSPSLETVRGLVANGLGYSLLVTKPANSMSYDGQALACRRLAEPVSSGRIVMAQSRSSTGSPLAAAFADHCKRHFAGLYAH